MFEKFTERGRKVIIYAREEAEKRQNDYLGTEHLPARSSERRRGNKRSNNQKDGHLNRRGAHGSRAETPLRHECAYIRRHTVYPACKKVLELAVEEARLIGHSYIGSEHLLLGILREDEGIAGRTLRKPRSKPSGCKAACNKFR